MKLLDGLARIGSDSPELLRSARDILASRALRLTAVLFYAFWFLVVVPGHTRGQISLLKDTNGKQQAHSCCAEDTSDSSKDGEPSSEAKRTCAVCYFTLGLTFPPVIAFDLDPAGKVTDLAMLWSEQVRSTKKFDPFHSRGPPAPIC